MAMLKTDCGLNAGHVSLLNERRVLRNLKLCSHSGIGFYNILNAWQKLCTAIHCKNYPLNVLIF